MVLGFFTQNVLGTKWVKNDGCVTESGRLDEHVAELRHFCDMGGV
jgi:hypothetical protein